MGLSAGALAEAGPQRTAKKMAGLPLAPKSREERVGGLARRSRSPANKDPDDTRSREDREEERAWRCMAMHPVAWRRRESEDRDLREGRPRAKPAKIAKKNAARYR
jgi:hypothetical protein